MPNKTFQKKKLWFLTFPQSGERDTEWIFNLFPKGDYHYKEVAGVMEQHDDGNPHLHFAMNLKRPLTKVQLLKKIEHIEPNDWKRIHVESGRLGVKSVYEGYLSKEGTPFYLDYNVRKVKPIWVIMGCSKEQWLSCQDLESDDFQEFYELMMNNCDERYK